MELSQLIGNMRILQKYFFIGGRVRLEIWNVSIGGKEWGDSVRKKGIPIHVSIELIAPFLQG